jgi:hypothetical protein
MPIHKNEDYKLSAVEYYDKVKKHKIEDIICYNEIGKRCVIKTQSQKIYWNIFYFYQRSFRLGVI